jgi:hypothetical protein
MEGAMRKKPNLWTGDDRIQWGCVLMQMLGEQSLEQLHLILSGLRSIDRSGQVAPFEAAVKTARIILGDMRTRQAVQNAVYDFQDAGIERSFQIDPRSLAFMPIYVASLDPNITKAGQILRAGLPRRTNMQTLADTAKDLVVSVEQDVRIPIRMHGVHFPEVRQHTRIARPRQQIVVRVAELETLAAELDAADQATGRKSLDWSSRVKILLQATTGRGLHRVDTLDLTHLKHLIGLPGAGKTTLITLLCVLLARRGLRITVFFTAIQVARDYLEILRRYEVSTAILMGRSGQTHRRHANSMAELIASQGDGGFARTREGIELFATSCPLPAFATSWPEHWLHGEAPCESLYEGTSTTPRLCPAWERCGRVKNQRELVEASVWLGHVQSSDTYVPAHTSDERLRYFELIAETFDLVIFDECDETQKVLDAYGALTLALTGNDESFHIQLQRITGRLAANLGPITDGLMRYSLNATEFERHTLRFVNEIRRLARDTRTQQLVKEYADQLLTANFLIREAQEAAGVGGQLTPAVLSAISDFWERAMYRAFFFRGTSEVGWPKAAKYAPDLGLTVPEANERWQHVNNALKQYLALDHAAAANEVIEEIAYELALLFGASSPDRIRNQVRLLITVGFTVASYQQLARSARPLAQRGEIDSDLVFAKASQELRELIPRSILGTFSAMRYRKAAERDGYEIDYLVMDTTPRLMLYRLHEVGRANVLLTSATSWLEPSTEYHVASKPDYVLAPRASEIGAVRLYLLPKRHPSTNKPLRFSGAGRDREDNLRLMVTALAQRDIDGLSDLEKAVRSITTELGRSRKAVLVVNSYEQVRLVVEQLNNVNQALGVRTRGVVKGMPTDNSRSHYILRGQVEELGHDDTLDVIVFPIAALGRGINVVFHTDDGDNGKAAIGAVYFLTRPHPAASDLTLMTSLLARATQEFDAQDLSGQSLLQIPEVFDRARHAVYGRIGNLLARPMSASQLDKRTLINFAANLLVPILQTIGRGMRKGMPVDVYFVDAAWAPNSAQGRPETDRSSILLVMRQVLEACLTDPDPDLRDIYHALYGVFQDAFRNIDGLLPLESSIRTPDNQFEPTTATAEVDFDNYDPDADLLEEVVETDEEPYDFDDTEISDIPYEDEEVFE